MGKGVEGARGGTAGGWDKAFRGICQTWRTAGSTTWSRPGKSSSRSTSRLWPRPKRRSAPTRSPVWSSRSSRRSATRGRKRRSRVKVKKPRAATRSAMLAAMRTGLSRNGRRARGRGRRGSGAVRLRGARWHPALHVRRRMAAPLTRRERAAPGLAALLHAAGGRSPPDPEPEDRGWDRRSPERSQGCPD